MNPKPRFILPNRLSFLRIGIGLVIPVFLLSPPGGNFAGKPWTLWAALVLFVLGTITDFWDGWIARRHRLETPLGRVLDPTADKVFILAVMASFSAMGIYSYWYLVPIFYREIAVTVCRIVWLREGHAIGAEKAGKLKLGFQVASVLASFLFLLLPNEGTALLNQVLILAAVGLTLYSGYFFFLHNRSLLAERKLLKTVATLGVGELPRFPGTCGSLLGLGVVPLIAHDPWLHLFVIVTILLLAYQVIPKLGLGAREDPLEIVIDEVAGILLSFWMIPLNVGSLLIGFIAFRIFDIVKVPPLNWLEKKPGVHGIMLDDIGAGVYTWLVLRILFS